MNSTVGQKIKNFRKRASKSQFELELDIDASPGSISRIESGEVNPTKETLMKITEALALTGIESSSLFGVDPNVASLLKIPSELLNSKDLNEILTKSVNNIVYELNLLSGFITIRKGDKLYAQITTERWFNKAIFSLIPVPFNHLNVDINKDLDNLCVKSYLNKEIYYSTDLAEVTVPAITPIVAKLMSKISGVKSGIVLPIVYNDICYGTFYVGKPFVDDYKNELPILKEFTKYIGEAISKLI